MRIAVTGSTSTIGQHLVNKLTGSGHTPILLGRNQLNAWKLGQELPKSLDIELLIHLAHDRSLTLKQNVEAASVLCASFHGPKIFLSSFSAHSKSLSKYGRSKYAIEGIFNDSNGSSIRAGVVYGEKIGGIYAQLELLVKKCPLIPIPYRGSPLLFTTHVDDLVEEILSTIGCSEGSTTFAAHFSPISLDNLCKKIQDSLGSTKPVVKVPRQPIDFFLKILTQYCPNFPMADSLLSLSSEANYEELSRLKLPVSNFREFKTYPKI
jgi:nucleoside-diphosphate-sugar epimerase